MTQSKNSTLRGIARSVMPALTVLIAGVTGAYLVYDNYMADRSMADQVLGFEPSSGAAGENNTASSLPAAAAAKVAGQNFKATDTATQAKPGDVKAAESDETGAGNQPAVDAAVQNNGPAATDPTYTQEGEDSDLTTAAPAAGAPSAPPPPQ